VVFCFLAVVLVNVLEEDGAFMRLKRCGISKALSCSVGGTVKIKTDHPFAMAVDRPSLIALYLTAQRLGTGDPTDLPFTYRVTPHANRAPPFLS
jgi:hypothetical protein